MFTDYFQLFCLNRHFSILNIFVDLSYENQTKKNTQNKIDYSSFLHNMMVIKLQQASWSTK